MTPSTLLLLTTPEAYAATCSFAASSTAIGAGASAASAGAASAAGAAEADLALFASLPPSPPSSGAALDALDPPFFPAFSAPPPPSSSSLFSFSTSLISVSHLLASSCGVRDLKNQSKRKRCDERASAFSSSQRP